MKKKRRLNRDLRYFLMRWSNLCNLAPEHTQWATEKFELISTRRGQYLLEEGSTQKNLFIVLRGAVANVYGAAKERYSILNVAIPYMALYSTSHLYSDTPILGDLQVIRSGKVLRIPYRELRHWGHQDEAINHLISMFSNKQIRFHYLLAEARNVKTLRQRYPLFCRLLPEFLSYLNESQQAQLLGISKSTIQASKRDQLRKK